MALLYTKTPPPSAAPTQPAAPPPPPPSAPPVVAQAPAAPASSADIDARVGRLRQSLATTAAAVKAMEAPGFFFPSPTDIEKAPAAQLVAWGREIALSLGASEVHP